MPETAGEGGAALRPARSDGGDLVPAAARGDGEMGGDGPGSDDPPTHGAAHFRTSDTSFSTTGMTRSSRKELRAPRAMPSGVKPSTRLCTS